MSYRMKFYTVKYIAVYNVLTYLTETRMMSVSIKLMMEVDIPI